MAVLAVIGESEQFTNGEREDGGMMTACSKGIVEVGVKELVRGPEMDIETKLVGRSESDM